MVADESLNGCGEAPADYIGELASLHNDDCPLTWKSVTRVRRTIRGENSVSYLVIPPPSWAKLQSDPYIIERPPPLQFSPSIIPITPLASCCCSVPRTMYTGGLPTREQPCMIYTLTCVYSSIIELQACMSCHRRFIGPDCRELGLFNFNNRLLFTHDLLDEYTSAFTMSETPFTAWIEVISRRYQNHSGSRPRFVTEEMFRAVWFAYAKLIYLEGDMQCLQCGPTPENTIWDGVTLAFHRKHLLPSLHPPTVIHDNATSRGRSRYAWSQQLLPEKKLRKMVRKVLVGPSLVVGVKSQVTPGGSVELGEGMNDRVDDGDEDGNTDDSSGVDAGTKVSQRAQAVDKRAKELFSRLEIIPIVYEKLIDVDMGLAEIFNRHFGLKAIIEGVPVPGVYYRVFMQVCVGLCWGKGEAYYFVPQISAEESVLQMTTRPALDKLQTFNECPAEENSSTLVDIPALYDLLQYEWSTCREFSPSILLLCKWIHRRGCATLNALLVHDLPPQDFHEPPTSWTKVRIIFIGDG